ncbi:MAG: GNAT family N-acetyltransferase [Parvibaculum sp.]|uniref:GNAT family N-acetyltransferase n=1 Tax=Parvibaculum sp. TaxID=2024848 RepID=UPI003C719BDB
MTDLKSQYPAFPALRRGSTAEVQLSSEADDGSICVLESAEALEPHVAEMEALAVASSDSNPLFEARALQAAMAHLRSGGPVRVALVRSAPLAGGEPLLIGVFPFQARRFYLGLPFAIWSIWTHVHGFLATPIVRAGYERQALRRFLAHADRAGAPLLRFPMFEGGGAFDAALSDVLAERGLAHVETGRHERAFLKSELDGEAYLAATMRKKKRKEYNRLWNRLAEAGELRFVTHDGGAELSAWVNRFLALERSGWKGKRGTALAERANERAFFERLCSEARARGSLHCAEILLDGKPIAMLASFLSGGGAHSFKIAYDEDYARYSPGALLMMKAVGAFLGDPRIAWVDSCAVPNHPMIDHIWAERRTIREVNAATAHLLSPLLIFYSARMTHIAEWAWDRMRTLYHRLRKEVEHG